MSPPPPPSPPSGAPAPATTELSCRICFDEDIRANLVRPCACAGSIAYVHPHCLCEWIARTESVASRSLCPQCKAPYDILTGPWTQRRRQARYLLTGLIFFGCAIFAATALPWYARCIKGGGWMPWQPEVLTFFSPGLLSRVGELDWEGGGGGWGAFFDWAQGGDGLAGCKMRGSWHLDAALVYGSIKFCSMAFNLICMQHILSGNLFAEVLGRAFALAISRILRLVRADRGQIDIEYAILCANTVAGLLWWYHAMHYPFGYIPKPGDSVLLWVLLELLGFVSVLRKLWLGIEWAELLLIGRGGKIPSGELHFYDRELQTYKCTAAPSEMTSSGVHVPLTQNNL